MSPWVLALLAVAVLGAGVLLLYNRFVRLRNRVHSARADLEVQLARRHDLIPNLVETVRGYAEHEQATFQELTNARTAGVAAHTVEEEAAADAQVRGALARVLAVAEAYPQLQADERFAALHDELVATENKLAFSRQLYNDTVQALRDATQSLPGVWLARPLGFSAPPFFAAEAAQRRPVQARFGEPGDRQGS